MRQGGVSRRHGLPETGEMQMPFVPYKLGTDPQFEKWLPDIEVQEGVK